MYSVIRKEQLIRPLQWEIVHLDYKGDDIIIAYFGGIAPVKIKNTGLTQKEFDKLYSDL